MNFRDQLVDSSKMIGDIVIRNVGCHPDYYKQILELVLYEPMPMSSRAGRVLNVCTENYPYLFQPHVKDVLNHLKKKKELHRCILKIFAEIPVHLDKNQEGILINSCFDWLADDSQSIATKAYCMDILANFAEKEPEIIPELISILKELLPAGSPGIISRASRIIKKLSGSNF